MAEPRSTRSSPSGKRQKSSPEEAQSGTEDPAPLADLLKKRTPSALIRNGQISDLHAGVHSDLRDLNWTIMVGPAMTPKAHYSAKLLEANKLVVHVVAVDYDTKAVANEQEGEDAQQEGAQNGGINIKGIFSLGFLGPAEDIAHLMTEEAVEDWRKNFLSEIAMDGKPRFVQSMVSMDKRKPDKWNRHKGPLLITHCISITPCIIFTRGAGDLERKTFVLCTASH